MQIKTFLILIFFFTFPLYAQEQKETPEEIKAKHAAYYLCIDNIEKKPQEAFGYCTDYLNKYSKDDPRLINFASGWVSAYRKISILVGATENDFKFEPGQDWSVYTPDLSKEIPLLKETSGRFKAETKREFASAEEEKLLRKAEAVYQSPAAQREVLFRQWRYWQQPEVELPPGVPKWWSGYSDTILAAEIPTTNAVLYYIEILQKFRDAGKIRENSFVFQSANLKYSSTIKKYEKYERGGKNFSGVYVADITLTWEQICGGLCGSGSTRNKVVVLNAKGEILGLFLDSPENNRSWVS